jgi:cell division protease FtsH
MQSPPGNKPNTPRIRWVWWLVILGALIVWNLLSFMPQSKPEVTIPYTTFLQQVNKGNVANVQIAGSQITGKFVQPVLWPQATPGVTPVASPQATPGVTPVASPQAAVTPAPTPASYTVFVTNFSEALGDPTLLPLLEKQNVQVTVSPPASPFLGDLLMTALPILLLVGVIIWMGRQATAGGQGGVFNFGRSKARRYVGDRTKVTFEDVAGEHEAKTDLMEVVDFLRYPQKYHRLGARIPRGVLLVGPPGTGKTLMARAVAGEAGVPFFSISASEFVEMFVGVGASRVRDLFTQAKENAPAIVFIDELDAVARRRGAGVGNVNDEREQTLNQLLVEMDGFDDRHEVIVMAATNRPDVLDPAIQRPGRFDRQVVVGLPDRQGREQILRIHSKHLPLAPDVDLARLAGGTTGFSGADLANLCNEAALIAARNSHSQVSPADFEEAVDKIVLGAERSLLLDARDKRVIAYHESGHALVAWLMPAADPVRKVTIIPRGRALGVTEQVPEEDRYNYSREHLLARVAVMMGGRTAEEIAIGDITTGAENDLVQATRLVRRMITRWGMGSLGTIAFQTDEQQPFLGYELSQGREYSEDTAMRIDQDVRQILEEHHQVARQLLTDARDKLDALAQTLLKEETLGEDMLVQILGPRPTAPVEVWQGAAVSAVTVAQSNSQSGSES